MTRASGVAGSAGWLFTIPADQLVTAPMLAAIGLPAGPLAQVRLKLARVSPAGKWHQAPSKAGALHRCPRLRQAAGRRRGRTVETGEAGLLDGIDLCGWCAVWLVVPGPPGAYLVLARHLLAAGAWVSALEAAAPSADWLACARWTARTPFTEPCPVPALIARLPAGQPWAACRTAAQAAWDRLGQRAEAAWDRARLAAGPPGYRALAACARSVAEANPDTRVESYFLDAITSTSGPSRRPLAGGDGGAWEVASAAWLDAVAADASTTAAEAALTAALEDRYAGAPVRNVSLLPVPGMCPAGDFGSPAEWAQAEFRALREDVASCWCQRLAGALAALHAEVDDDWLLLRVAGWPLTEDRDRELAYLASYPELARIPDPDCGHQCGRDHPSWVVVLHVPGFAALHAIAHDGAHLDITSGPLIPAGAQPSRAQVDALLHAETGQEHGGGRLPLARDGS